MKKIKVGVIGIGVMGRSHVRVYSSMKNAELVAIADSSQENLDSAEQEFGLDKVAKYTDFRKMIKEESMDAVSICVPTKMHFEAAQAAIKAGLHVLVEKPMTATVEEAQKLISLANQHKTKLFIGHIERFNPVVQELKKRILENEIGTIYNISSFRLSPFPKRILDVGVTIDLAVHEIDIINYLTGSKLDYVYAETARRIHSKSEDLLVATLRFDNHILGVINCNWLTPRKVREITITGEKGMFVANYLAQELHFYQNEFTNGKMDYSKGPFSVVEGRMQKIEIEKKEPLAEELNSFVNCIINDEQPLVTGADGLHAIDVAAKLLESARTKQVMKL